MSICDIVFQYVHMNEFKMLANENLININIILYEPPKLITNISEINKILHDHHTAPAGGHVGKTRLLKKLIIGMV